MDYNGKKGGFKLSKNSQRKYGWLYPFIVLSCFFVSFSVSAYIFMSSSNLVFSENEEELKSLNESLSEKEAEITSLEFQLERYKTLYENELSKAEPYEITK